MSHHSFSQGRYLAVVICGKHIFYVENTAMKGGNDTKLVESSIRGCSKRELILLDAQNRLEKCIPVHFKLVISNNVAEKLHDDNLFF